MVLDPLKHLLGKAPKENDPKGRTLKVARYFKLRALPAIAAAVFWGAAMSIPWGMCLNDVLGCCALAAPVHQVMSWTANTRTAPEVIPDDTIRPLYNRLSPNDNGLSMLRVLKLWLNEGIGGHKILAFAEIENTNADRFIYHIKASIDILGGVYMGFQMPISVRNQDVWDIPDEGLTGEGTPGSWGGHAVEGLGFGINPAWQQFMIKGWDQDGVLLCSWGKIYRATWRFVLAYYDECYAVVSQDWVDSDTGQSPFHLDIPSMIQDAELLRAA